MADAGQVDFQVYIVEADKNVKDARHTDRKDTQEDQFLRSKETKIEGVMSNMTLMGYIKRCQNNTREDLDRIVNELREHFMIEANNGN